MKTSMFRIGRQRGLLSVLLVFLLVASLGCERKPGDLEQWRTAKGGMQKMQEWAQSDEEPRDVRIRAVEILIEEGQVNQLKPTLEGVADTKLRAEMVAAVVPTVEKMWAANDYPKISEADEEKGAVKVGASESVVAKDAAFFLIPFAEGAEKEKLQKILAEWMSADWQLRNQLGNVKLNQIAEYAGEAGNKGLLDWLKVAIEPHRPADMIARGGDDATQEKAALILLERANADYPKLTPSLNGAVMATNRAELAPLFKKMINDPESSGGTIDAAMDALVRVQDRRAAPFFSDLIGKRGGQIRWVAADRISEVLGKPAFTFVSTALPVEMDTYPGQDSEGFKKEATGYCGLYKAKMAKAGTTDVSDELKKGLESARWPARVLGLKCAEVFKSTDLAADVDALKSDRQQVPGWGEATTVGAIATEVAATLSK